MWIFGRKQVRIPQYDIPWRDPRYLDPRDMFAKSRSYNNRGSNKMADPITDIIRDIEKSLSDHDAALSTVEGLISRQAERAIVDVNPTQLLAVRDRIRGHTERLSNLMSKLSPAP
jgi:hypothetical protein